MVVPGATSSSDSVVSKTAENRSNDGLETMPNSPVLILASELCPLLKLVPR
jgi:hypothetical protein